MILEEAMKDIADNEYRTEKIEHESLMWLWIAWKNTKIGSIQSMSG